jgi:hypothetical protein
MILLRTAAGLDLAERSAADTTVAARAGAFVAGPAS